MIQKRKSVLLVDNEAEILELMAEALDEVGLRVVTAVDGLDASMKLSNESFDMVVTDLHIPKKDGGRLVQEILRNTPNTPILVITGDLDSYKTDISMHKNLSVLEKPFDLTLFAEKVLKILDPLGTITAGELVGEMSFIDHRERSAYVKAVEDSEVLVIPCSKFTKILESQPQWLKNLVKNLSLRLRETNKKVHI